jgi:hypothetical protein
MKILYTTEEIFCVCRGKLVTTVPSAFSSEILCNCILKSTSWRDTWATLAVTSTAKGCTPVFQKLYTKKKKNKKLKP